MRILLVEDQAPMARLLRENLADAKLGRGLVEHVTTLTDAMDALRGELRFDAVLLDLGLPDSRGLSTLDTIRQGFPNQPVVVLTNLDDPDVAIAALHDGADDYLVKGQISPMSLARAVRYAVERREAQQKQVRLIETVQGIGESIVTELDLDAVVERVVGEATSRTRATHGMLCYWKTGDRDSEPSYVVAGSLEGVPADVLQQLISLPTAQARDRTIENVFDTADRHGDPVGRLLGVRSYMTVPIAPTHAPSEGRLLLAHVDPGHFTRRDEDLAAGIATWAGVAMHNAWLFGERDNAVATREHVLAVVSHDLRNPLNVIATASDLLEDCDDRDERCLYIDKLRRATERMRHLIGDLLDYASIDAGTLSIQRDNDDLRQIAREAIDSVAAEAGRKDIVIHSDLAQVPPVEVDRARMVQALCNLIGNAVKFTPEGGHVEVDLRPIGDEVQLSVRDTGPGIPPKDLARLFDRFYKGSTSRREGAGLGLAITKGIADAHGGRLHVASEVGRGSTFTLILPIAATEHEQPREAPA